MMHRLNDKDRAMIEKILDYTPSELSVICQVKQVQIAKHLPFTTQIDYRRYSTTQGVSDQLDDFTSRIGILHIFTFDWPNKSFELSRFGVECNRPWEPVTFK